MIPLAASQQLAAVNNLQTVDTYMHSSNDVAYAFYQDYTNDPTGNPVFQQIVGQFIARSLSTIQAIVSLLAIPILFLAVLFVPAITSFTQNRDVGTLYAQGIGGLIGSSIFQIPNSLLGAIVPSTLVQRDHGPDLSDEDLQHRVQQTMQGMMAQFQ